MKTPDKVVTSVLVMDPRCIPLAQAQAKAITALKALWQRRDVLTQSAFARAIRELHAQA